MSATPRAQNFNLHNTALFHRLYPKISSSLNLSRVRGFPAALALLSAPRLARPFLGWLSVSALFCGFCGFCFPCAVLASLASIIGRNRLNLWSLSPTVIVHRVSKLVLRVMRACTRPSCQQPRRRATRHAEGRRRHCGGYRAQSVLLDWTSTERPRECYGKADREISSPFLPGRLPEIRVAPGWGFAPGARC
jgi:hypothetical protein